MDDYIERKALRDALYDADAITMTGVKILNQFPPADVAPVRRGRWENYDPYSDGYRCSCCKLVHRTCTGYCPNCGAKMDLEE